MVPRLAAAMNQLDNFFMQRFFLPLIMVLPGLAQAQVQVQVQQLVDPPVGTDLEIANLDDEILTNEEFDLPIDPTAATSADELIPMLGSPSYEEREEATAGLIEIGAPAFAKLRAAYHETTKLEVLLRIENIVRTAYLNHHVYDRSGFLGINLQSFLAGEESPRLPAGTVGVRVGRVIENTAAERAGMLKDDIIFEVDGQPLTGDGMQVVENFSAMIRARGPGGRMNLTVLRGTEEIPMLVTIGRCPIDIAKQGTVRAVSENHYRATARFPKWWAKYFAQTKDHAVQMGKTLN